MGWVKSSPEIICSTSFDSELIFLLIWHGIRVPFLLRIINLPSTGWKYVLKSFIPCSSNNFTYNLQIYAMVRWDIPIKMLSAYKNETKIKYHIDMIFIWYCACTCMYVWYVCMVCMLNLLSMLLLIIRLKLYQWTSTPSGSSLGSWKQEKREKN